MAKKYVKKVKERRSTDDLIDNAIAQQNSWMENRRTFARKFLKTLNIFARPAPDKNSDVNDSDVQLNQQAKYSGLGAYWFPILCAIIVAIIAIWVLFIHKPDETSVIVINDVSTVTTETIDPLPLIAESTPAEIKIPDAPEFDIVRIAPDGKLVIAGRWVPNKSVSVVVNDKIIVTEQTNEYGEFVYSPSREFESGNYTISLIGAEDDIKSTQDVFVYISPNGYENSVSLLMTDDGSKLMQSPRALSDADLNVTKIDYLDTGRLVVTGDALPRLRVSLTLNDKFLGETRVSDHRHFGLGADVGCLETGIEYTLTVRLHDTNGQTIAQITHIFYMPDMTGIDDTFYTVRRGDCLWIIAKNFLRRGILFTIIAEQNNLENPDLIFPNQILQIPVKEL